MALSCALFAILTALYLLQAEHLQELQPDAAGIIYEVRVYSLEAATLGEVLHARQIRAAHCLPSVQLSPTSDHLLLPYGRYTSSIWRAYKQASKHHVALSLVNCTAHLVCLRPQNPQFEMTLQQDLGHTRILRNPFMERHYCLLLQATYLLVAESCS